MKKKNKSCKQAEALVQRHLLPRWGSLQAAAITRSDVKAVISSIARPVLANQVLAACSAVFSWAVREAQGQSVRRRRAQSTAVLGGV